jgi:hypothetical protein
MDFYNIVLTLHVVSAAVGVGAAATSDSIFLNSIRNRIISRDQFILIQAASRIVLGGLTLLVLTGIFLMFKNEHLMGMPHFQAKMTVVVILMLNGLLFHARLLPFFKQNLNEKLSEDLITLKLKLFAITGAISAVSWFTALIIAVIGHVGIVGAGYFTIMGIYLFLIVAGSVASYFILSHLIFWSSQPRVQKSGGSKGLVHLIVLLVLLVLSFLVIIFK